MLHLVTAVIKPHRLEAVRDALQAQGISGITVTEVQGFGRQRGHTETYRGTEYKIDFVPKIKLEILAATEDAERLAGAIADAAQTGKIGDGKIWVTEVDRAMRIRTGEVGLEAV